MGMTTSMAEWAGLTGHEELYSRLMDVLEEMERVRQTSLVQQELGQASGP